MLKKELVKKIAQMESYVDQLETEIAYIDELLQLIGFSEGLTSIKRSALELLQKQQEKEKHETIGEG